MSREIIEAGHIPTFVIRCDYCGTLFTYNRSDVYRTGRMGRKLVPCPRCDKYLKPTYVNYTEASGKASFDCSAPDCLDCERNDECNHIGLFEADE